MATTLPLLFLRSVTMGGGGVVGGSTKLGKNLLQEEQILSFKIRSPTLSGEVTEFVSLHKIAKKKQTKTKNVGLCTIHLHVPFHTTSII